MARNLPSSSSVQLAEAHGWLCALPVPKIDCAVRCRVSLTWSRSTIWIAPGNNSCAVFHIHIPYPGRAVADDGSARSVTETPAGGLTQDTLREGGTFDAVERGGALDGR